MKAEREEGLGRQFSRRTKAPDSRAAPNPAVPPLRFAHQPARQPSLHYSTPPSSSIPHGTPPPLSPLLTLPPLLHLQTRQRRGAGVVVVVGVVVGKGCAGTRREGGEGRRE